MMQRHELELTVCRRDRGVECKFDAIVRHSGEERASGFRAARAARKGAGERRSEPRYVPREPEHSAMTSDRDQGHPGSANREVALNQEPQLVRGDVSAAPFDVVEQVDEDVVV